MNIGFSPTFQVFSVVGALLMGLSETAGSFEMLVVGRLHAEADCRATRRGAWNASLSPGCTAVPPR